MSDETTEPVTQYDFESDPDGVREEDVRPKDALLDLLLGVVPGDSDSDSSVGVTVIVNGVVISGLAVSYEHWRKLWTKTLGEANEALGEGFDTALTVWSKENADVVARREAENRPIPSQGFLHLTDAKILTGGHTRRVGLMRVRRSQIDAWTLGHSSG